MFTGLIEEAGLVRGLAPHGAGWRLRVAAGGMLASVALGDSIAIDGACLTVVARDAHTFAVEATFETLRRTTLGDRVTGDGVHLERAMAAGGRFGGHFVQGHVDGLGTVTRFAPVGESHELRILAPVEIGRYLAYKGSVTVNGVSLTVNSVDDRADDPALPFESRRIEAHWVGIPVSQRR